MLEGWYCRSLANQEGAVKEEPQPDSDEEPAPPVGGRSQVAVRGGVAASSSSASAGTGTAAVDYKERYKNLKKKLKFLIYVRVSFLHCREETQNFSCCRRTSTSRIYCTRISGDC